MSRWVVTVSESRMERVVRPNERSFAPALNKSPALVRLFPVVVTAQPVEEVEGGDLGLGEVLSMIVLQPRPRAATLYCTSRRKEVQGGSLVSIGTSAVVVNAGKGLASGEEPDDEGVLGSE
jgi:hypothetical protein